MKKEGAWAEALKALVDEHFANVAYDMERYFDPSLPPREKKFHEFKTTWYKYKCLKTHDYVWRQQDVNSGKHYSFEEGKEYDFRTGPKDLMHVAKHPEHFEFIKEWIEDRSFYA